MITRRALTHLFLPLLALAVVLHARGARAQEPVQSTETSHRSHLAAAPIDTADGRDGEQPAAARNDNLHVGGVIGAGFPRPLAFEAMMKVQRLVSIGVEYSLLPSTTIAGVDTSFWALAADMRLFPLRDGFFVGLRTGAQHLAADTVLVVDGQRYPIAASVQTMFVNPRVGVLWTWSSGFTLGLDVGLQIPVSSRSRGVLVATEGLALPEGMEIVDQVRGVAEYLGQSTIPTVDLLRVGLLL